MTAPDRSLTLHEDQAPERATFLAEALAGLRATPRTLPCKYFYDEIGSELFEAICQLDVYYPTRTELGIMREHAPEMAAELGERCMLVEYGSGTSEKTRILLDHLSKPAAYVPVDISGEHLLESAQATAADRPDLEVLPVCADFTREVELPVPSTEPARTVVYFPGSTIGNFGPEAATGLLDGMAELCAPDGGCLVGADLVKDRDVLRRAYDDPEGTTAAFNLGVLRRLRDDLGAELDLEGFEHEARWNEEHLRIEMHLRSTRSQTIRLGDETFAFAAGETICTEHSHKYTLDGFAALAADAGLRVETVWTDPKGWFSVQYLVLR